VLVAVLEEGRVGERVNFVVRGVRSLDAGGVVGIVRLERVLEVLFVKEIGAADQIQVVVVDDGEEVVLHVVPPWWEVDGALQLLDKEPSGLCFVGRC
jgi:hypothetical protein